MTCGTGRGTGRVADGTRAGRNQCVAGCLAGCLDDDADQVQGGQICVGFDLGESRQTRLASRSTSATSPIGMPGTNGLSFSLPSVTTTLPGSTAACAFRISRRQRITTVPVTEPISRTPRCLAPTENEGSVTSKIVAVVGPTEMTLPTRPSPFSTVMSRRHAVASSGVHGD